MKFIFIVIVLIMFVVLVCGGGDFGSSVSIVFGINVLLV